MNERQITDDEVRQEHHDEVSERAHWLYLVGVLIGGAVLMIGLIALLGGSA